MRAILGILPIVFLLACEGRRDDRNVLAKIGKDKYYLSDLEKLTKTLPLSRQSEVLTQPDDKRDYFELVLKQRLMALAAKEEGFADNKDLQKRLEVSNQRIITQHYYEHFLGENAGFTDEELNAFYKTHTAMFQNDSGKPLPFVEAKKLVVDSLLVSRANLDSFYQANTATYERKAHCNVSYIRSNTEKDAKSAYQNLRDGAEFKQIGLKYDLAQQLRTAKLLKAETHWDLGATQNWDSLFFNEKAPVKPGTFFGPLRKDGEFLVVRADSCSPYHVPALAEVRGKVIEDYVSNYRTRLNETALDKLKAKYGAKIVDVNSGADEAALKKYYDANKKLYQSPPTYEIFHIEGKSKEAIAPKLKGVKDLEGFKKIASQVSENSWTREKQGNVGIIKRDHALPYGIGMLPSLFPALDTLKAGSLTEGILNPESGKWHWFWLVASKPQQQKPFDRVKVLVRQDLQSDKTREIAPGDTLATFADSKVIRESDVQFLAEEIPAHLRSRYTRDRLVDYLLTWELMTLEANKLGLTSDIKLQAMLLDSKDRYWAEIYRDSVLQKNYALDPDLLKRTFAKNRQYFIRSGEDGDYTAHVKDIAAFLALDSSEIPLEYHLNPERYTRNDTLISLDSARYEVFQNLKSKGYALSEAQLFSRLKKRFDVVIVDESLKEPKISDANAVFRQAQNLHYDRQLEKSLELYERLRVQFPDNHSLQDSVAFGMAQIFIEQERYQNALSEYRRISYLYPKSSNEYKAQFMVGFIQAEHMKDDSAAVRTFRKMLAKHPESDLSDDADWMIRNIESGGALMPVLQDETEADSKPAEGG